MKIPPAEVLLGRIRRKAMRHSQNQGTDGSDADQVRGPSQRKSRECLDTPKPSLPAPIIRLEILLAAIGTALFLLILLRHAWLSDDAFITFRSVKNFIAGRGLRWNMHERVQSFTHPLWFFVLSLGHLVTREAYFSSLFLSLVLSMATVVLVTFRLAPGGGTALLGLAIFTSSKSFVDYSTSGLENPLTHLLLVLFVLRWLSLPALRGEPFKPTPQSEPQDPCRRLFDLGLLAGLLALNRLDAILFCLPVLAIEAWRARRAAWVLIPAFLPLFAWEIFSVIYYGFPFPNTAYAKLGARIPSSELANQGVHYFLSELNHDPLALMVMLAGCTVPFLARDKRLYPLIWGTLLYCIYIVRIGGDFMAGRFFAAPLLMATLALLCSAHALLSREHGPFWVPALAVLIAAVVLTPRPTLTSDASYPDNEKDKGILDDRGIADERAWYYKTTALLRHARGVAVEKAMIRSDFPVIVPGKATVHDVVGAFGYVADPYSIIVDRWALTDPLLARLPAAAPHQWRIGHLTRHIPAGYLQTLERGRTLITDGNIAQYYDHLAKITTGPIFTWDRFRTIWNFSLGRYEHLLDR